MCCAFGRTLREVSFYSDREARICAQYVVPLNGGEADECTVRGDREANGERGYLTMLFCDLVGSTVVSAALDPEEWRGMIVFSDPFS
jgi:class 3 adenylate cyclase